jgi:hypothetical protein
MITFNHIAGAFNNKNAAFFKAYVEICDSKITGFLLCSSNTGMEALTTTKQQQPQKNIQFDFNASPDACRNFRISAVYSRNN